MSNLINQSIIFVCSERPVDLELTLSFHGINCSNFTKLPRITHEQLFSFIDEVDDYSESPFDLDNLSRTSTIQPYIVDPKYINICRNGGLSKTGILSVEDELHNINRPLKQEIVDKVLINSSNNHTLLVGADEYDYFNLDYSNIKNIETYFSIGPNLLSLLRLIGNLNSLVTSGINKCNLHYTRVNVRKLDVLNLNNALLNMINPESVVDLRMCFHDLVSSINDYLSEFTNLEQLSCYFSTVTKLELEQLKKLSCLEIRLKSNDQISNLLKVILTINANFPQIDIKLAGITIEQYNKVIRDTAPFVQEILFTDQMNYHEHKNNIYTLVYQVNNLNKFRMKYGNIDLSVRSINEETEVIDMLDGVE